MKERIAKLIITVAAIALVLPFVAVALLVGVQASAGADNMQDDLLLVVIAAGGAAASMLKNMSRKAQAQSGKTALHIASGRARRNSRKAFINVPSQTSFN